MKLGRIAIALGAGSLVVALVGPVASGSPGQQSTTEPRSVSAAEPAAQPAAKGKASIAVAVSGLPDGVAASVLIKGTGKLKKYKKKITGSTTVKKLAAGKYKITAAAVTANGDSTSVTVEPSVVTLKKKTKASVAVDYTVGNAVGLSIAQAVKGKGVKITGADFAGSDLAQGQVTGLFGTGKSGGTKTSTRAAGDVWLLSTGFVSQAVGPVTDFASENLGLPGSPTLSALVNNLETFDATTVEMQVVPSGSTLSIQYRFASEEYPEYSNSDYNDVMRILVNNQVCSRVPGTDLPVAVNTINQTANSQYFVNNETSPQQAPAVYDGFTTVLTCSVAVTPGTPVSVVVSIADTSDGIYDSAVALLDQGITSS